MRTSGGHHLLSVRSKGGAGANGGGGGGGGANIKMDQG